MVTIKMPNVGINFAPSYGMSLYKNKYRNESTRLKNWNYTNPGYYFVTICTKHRAHLFGKIDNGKMILNAAGNIVLTCWQALPNHYPNVLLDEFVIMPHHIHGIIGIKYRIMCAHDGFTTATVGSGLNPDPTVAVVTTTAMDGTTMTIPRTSTILLPPGIMEPRPTHSISEFVRALKTFSARRINEMRQTPGIPV